MKANNSEPVAGRKRLIYAVDDEPMLLDLAAAILEPLGYSVRTFRDGESALQAYTVAQPPPDLLITDYAMLQMNGMQFIEACRRLHPNQKALLLSGTVDELIYDISNCKPDSFLAKPYQPKELADVVQRLLGN